MEFLGKFVGSWSSWHSPVLGMYSVLQQELCLMFLIGCYCDCCCCQGGMQCSELKTLIWLWWQTMKINLSLRAEFWQLASFLKYIHKAWDIILYFLTVQSERLHAVDTYEYVKLNALWKQIILSQMYTSWKVVEFLAALGLPEMELIFLTVLSFVLVAKRCWSDPSALSSAGTALGLYPQHFPSPAAWRGGQEHGTQPGQPTQADQRDPPFLLHQQEKLRESRTRGGIYFDVCLLEQSPDVSSSPTAWEMAGHCLLMESKE